MHALTAIIVLLTGVARPADPAGEPGTRTSHVMSWHHRLESVVLLGGADDAALWGWDGKTWSRLGEGGPGGRKHLGMAYDRDRDRLVVQGGFEGPREDLRRYGDTWEWDGESWREIDAHGPGVRDHHAMAYDEARGEIVLFGGSRWTVDSAGASRSTFLGDTWSWDGERWRRLDVVGPPARSTHRMVWDSRREVVVLFGGYGEDGRLADTWAWNGRSWRLVDDGRGPSPRFATRLAYDAARGEVVLHGGRGVDGDLGDTWTWDGSRWARRRVDGPGPRNVHGMAYDALRERVVLHGGLADGERRDDTWEWNGSAWRRVPASDERVGSSRNGLDRGPHGVGFRLIQAYDSTRAFRAKRDHRGRRVDGETARPVQIALWYPARTGPDDRRMTAGEFRFLRESELDFEEPTGEERESIRRALLETVGELGIPEESVRSTLDDRTPAVRGAPAVPGPHPTVLYVGAAYVSDPRTPAYLASHGFAVAAFPTNGRMTETTLEFSPNPLTLDTDVDDAGFVYGLLRREALVDTDRLAVYGFSSSSLAALLWQMRDLQADAVVTVEGWERLRRGADLIRASPHYDPRRIRVPLLMVERAGVEAPPAYAEVGDVVDSLAHAPRLRVGFHAGEHADFLSHAIRPGSDAADRVYAESARIVRWFLEAHLAGREEAAGRLAGLESPDALFTASRGEADPPAPSEEEFFRMAELDPERAVRTYRTVDPERPLFREHVLARVARFTEAAGDRALLWTLIVEEYPTSTAARYGLGTSLEEADRPEEARRALEEALDRLGDDPSLDGEARRSWRERIEKALAGIGSASGG